MKCPKCKNKQQHGAKYCSNCGASIVKTISATKKRSNQNYRKKNADIHSKSIYKHLEILFNTKTIYISICVVLASFLILTILMKNESSFIGGNKRFMDEKSNNPIIETKVFKIASKFKCGCGKCNELSLEQCKCDFAIDERAFIRDYLERSASESEVIMAVNAKYGFMKNNN